MTLAKVAWMGLCYAGASLLVLASFGTTSTTGAIVVLVLAGLVAVIGTITELDV